MSSHFLFFDLIQSCPLTQRLEEDPEGTGHERTHPPRPDTFFLPLGSLNTAVTITAMAVVLGTELRPSDRLGKHFTSRYIPSLYVFILRQSLIKLPRLVITEAPMLGAVGEPLGIESPSHIYEEQCFVGKTFLRSL